MSSKDNIPAAASSQPSARNELMRMKLEDSDRRNEELLLQVIVLEAKSTKFERENEELKKKLETSGDLYEAALRRDSEQRTKIFELEQKIANLKAGRQINRAKIDELIRFNGHLMERMSQIHSLSVRMHSLGNQTYSLGDQQHRLINQMHGLRSPSVPEDCVDKQLTSEAGTSPKVPSPSEWQHPLASVKTVVQYTIGPQEPADKPKRDSSGEVEGRPRQKSVQSSRRTFPSSSEDILQTPSSPQIRTPTGQQPPYLVSLHLPSSAEREARSGIRGPRDRI